MQREYKEAKPTDVYNRRMRCRLVVKVLELTHWNAREILGFQILFSVFKWLIKSPN